jgi:hypothetical protein
MRKLKEKHGWDKEHKRYLCSDGYHNSFYFTIIQSKEWEKWRAYNEKKLLYDVWECEGCGWISPNHWSDFIKFLTKKR